MEREIGEIFKHNGIKLQVVEAPFCEDCYFRNEFPCFGKPHIASTGDCEYVMRNNSKSVVFKKLD